MTLKDLYVGDFFQVNQIILEGEIGKRLADMGFHEGVRGEVTRFALLGDPIAVRILDYDVSIRKSEAAGIEIQWLGSRFPVGRRHGRGWRRRGKGRRGYGCCTD